MSVDIEDGLSNVHRAKINYRLQGDTQFFRLPFGSFSVYRARVQPAFSISTLIEIIRNAEIKPLGRAGEEADQAHHHTGGPPVRRPRGV